MKKRYTVTNILFNEISSDFLRAKGTLEYYLIDEEGNERKVITIAELGRGKKIKTVRALYQREKPLVDALVNVEIDQEVVIDFSKYNKHMPASRLVSNRSRSVSKISPHVLIHEHSFSEIIPDASRIPFLMTLVILGTLLVFVLSIFS